MPPIDDRLMDTALELAKRGLGSVEPNPMVGCVIVRDGGIIGRGYHERFGGPHAEINALASITDGNAAGATAHVTLEPCCHHGKTPPCADALIAAKLARVVIGTVDPFAAVDGGGIAKLRAAGIRVDVGVRQHECDQLIAAFRKLVRTQTPYVRAKWAMTMDGRIATRTGGSQWITGPAARADVHRTRSISDAILVGMGTVRADDPLLSARPDADFKTPNRTLHRIVLCRQTLPSTESQLVRSATQHPLILVVGSRLADESIQPLIDAGVVIVRSGSNNHSDIARAALRYAGLNRWTNLIVEGGAEIFGEFFDGDLVDACDIYIGAKCFGSAAARGPVAGIGAAAVSDSKAFALTGTFPFEHDIKLQYERPAPNN